MEIVLNALCYVGGCLPAALHRNISWKHWGWSLACCPVLCVVLRAVGMSAWLSAGVFSVLLGVCCVVSLWKQTPMWALLCWGGGIGAVSGAAQFCRAMAADGAAFLTALFALVIGGGIGMALRWFSRWPIPESLQLSQERSVSPLPVVAAIEGMTFASLLAETDQTIMAGLYVLACQGVVLLLLRLWRDSAVAVVHSQEDSSSQRDRVAEIESADRLTLARLQQDLSRSQILFEELAREFELRDFVRLRELLREATTPKERPVFCDVPLLNTVLLRCSQELREKGWWPDILLELGGLDGIAAAEIGVLLDLMLHFMMEARPSGEKPAMRLRVQECAGILAVAAGCTGQLHDIPREKWEAIHQTVKEQNGWCEWTEVSYGLRLNVVLYKKA